MKYEKGSFVLIPNKEYLKGKPSELQAIYLWICDHSNESGICFPTRKKIASEAGCGIKTVDKYLKVLVDEELLSIVIRKKKGTNENTSSVYQLMLKTTLVSKTTPPSVENDPTPRVEKGNGTIPNLNHNNLIINPEQVGEIVSLKKEIPYSFEEEFNKLKESTKKVDKIIYIYWLRKRWRFENVKQFYAQFKRELRPARALEGYNSEQLTEAMEYCEEKHNTYGWTLETLLKVMPIIINK